MSDKKEVTLRKWTFSLEDKDVPFSKNGIDGIGFLDRVSDESSTGAKAREQKQSNIELRNKKVWELAKSPFQSIFMTMFMLWMSGGGINIFSIMITFFTMWNPIKSILGVNDMFDKYAEEGVQLLLPKLVYILLNLAVVGAGVYKCWGLGLLPTTPSDWVSSLPLKHAVEFSGLMN